MYKTNKVVRLSFSGGLLGFVFGSTRGKFDNVISEHNKEGWNLAEVVPDNPNLAIWLLRVIILIATLGLWTISVGYLLILEKPVVAGSSRADDGVAKDTGRREPMLYSNR